MRSGQRKSTGEKVAIKCVNISKLSENDEKDILNEIAIMREVNHPHVVRLLDSFRDDECGFIFLVLEMIGGGELFDWIVSKDEYLEEEARDLMYSLLQTIAHLHHNKIAHSKTFVILEYNGVHTLY